MAANDQTAAEPVHISLLSDIQAIYINKLRNLLNEEADLEYHCNYTGIFAFCQPSRYITAPTNIDAHKSIVENQLQDWAARVLQQEQRQQWTHIRSIEKQYDEMYIEYQTKRHYC